MFSVRVFVAQNICLLYLSISSCILMLCNFFGGEFGIFLGETFPPEVPRINPVHGVEFMNEIDSVEPPL